MENNSVVGNGVRYDKNGNPVDIKGNILTDEELANYQNKTGYSPKNGLVYDKEGNVVDITKNTGGGIGELPSDVPRVYRSATRPENLRPIDFWIETKGEV